MGLLPENMTFEYFWRKLTDSHVGALKYAIWLSQVSSVPKSCRRIKWRFPIHTYLPLWWSEVRKKRVFFCSFHFRKLPLFCRSFLISSFWNLAICTKERINLGSCCFAIQQIESLDPASRAEAMEHFTKMLEVETNCFVTFGHTFITEWMVIVWWWLHIMKLFATFPYKTTRHMIQWMYSLHIHTTQLVFVADVFWGMRGNLTMWAKCRCFFDRTYKITMHLAPWSMNPPRAGQTLEHLSFFPFMSSHILSAHSLLNILSWTGETQTHSRI